MKIISTTGDKAVYVAPKLVVYGDAKKLTAAGSTGPSEGQSGQLDKKP